MAAGTTVFAQDGHRDRARNIDFASELGLDEAQANAVQEIIAEQREKMSVLRDSENSSREAGAEVREAARAKLAEILNAEQLEKLSEITRGRGNRDGRDGNEDRRDQERSDS